MRFLLFAVAVRAFVGRRDDRPCLSSVSFFAGSVLSAVLPLEKALRATGTERLIAIFKSDDIIFLSCALTEKIGAERKIFLLKRAFLGKSIDKRLKLLYNICVCARKAARSDGNLYCVYNTQIMERKVEYEELSFV